MHFEFRANSEFFRALPGKFRAPVGDSEQIPSARCRFRANSGQFRAIPGKFRASLHCSCGANKRTRGCPFEETLLLSGACPCDFTNCIGTLSLCHNFLPDVAPSLRFAYASRPCNAAQTFTGGLDWILWILANSALLRAQEAARALGPWTSNS